MGLFDFFKQEDINQGIEEYKKTPGVHKIKKGISGRAYTRK